MSDHYLVEARVEVFGKGNNMGERLVKVSEFGKETCEEMLGEIECRMAKHESKKKPRVRNVR